MTDTAKFIYTKPKQSLSTGKFSWRAPSNIALIKYWGKTEPQIPKNASLSFTLSHCYTETVLYFSPKEVEHKDFDFEVFVKNVKMPDFKPKIETFFKRIEKYVPFLKDYSFEIHTYNSFPHSSGIASSASSMGAIALCIMSMEKSLDSDMDEAYFYQKASFLARLGSGSAARSIQGAAVVWGEHPKLPETSDIYGINVSEYLHPVFTNFQDSVLLVDKGQKKVSSTLGHQLMEGHPFADERFTQANRHLSSLLEILKNGDEKAFIEMVEQEALTLHAMMLTSSPNFILMKPETLSIIEKVRDFREKTDAFVCFTLDAGANVHLLYPEYEKDAIREFIDGELKIFCQDGQVIHDQIGKGAVEVK